MSINSLFNPSFLKKKLTEYKNIDSDKIKNAREIFERWNTSVDLTKEKESQQSFLKEFFEEILGYQGVAGKKDNSLWWESGSQVDGKKPDGILGFNLASYKAETVSMKDAGDVRVVIELKDCTVNLDKNQKRKEFHGTPIEQGFSYASKVGSSCEFVIISNFKQIRLYKYGQGGGEGKYHEFLLDDLANSDDKIKEFHFLLSKDQLFTKVNNQSQVHSLDMTDRGEEIQNEFYRWYKQLREEIWDNLVELNKDKPFGRNFYLYKAQKLIDRIIFIRFCRENNALDGDSVRQALDNTFVPTKYERLKYLFLAMDKGRPEIGIAKFNGGLFAEDAELDSLNVSDDIIDKIVLLYSHDFGSDLDVNILGHIFEQSISDLEKLSNDKPAEKKKAKSNEREKHGVFYTPPFITEFIINAAIGSWVNDRKAEIKAKEGSKEFWQEYAEKLKTIKILDPACGSGAFLVKVFDYLQNEWREVKKHIKTDWDYKDILRNNIYGVDINVASIGITKLSLWLKTARYCREFKEPLTALDGNIKVGNSLIDDKRVAGFYHEYEGKVVHESITIHSGLFEAGEIKKYEEQHKKSLAFKWKEEFVAVFEQGGFDVIVGNPPYVSAVTARMSKEVRDYYVNKYECVDGAFDLYLLFLLQCLRLIKQNGRFGYIVPNKLLSANYAKRGLDYLCSTNECTSYDVSSLNIFEGAAVYPIIFTGNSGECGISKYQISNFEPLTINVCNDTLQEYKTFKDFGISVECGAAGFEADKIAQNIYENSGDDKIPFIVSGSVDKYSINYTGVQYMKQRYKNAFVDINCVSENRKKLWMNSKIIIAGMTKEVEAVFADKPLGLGVGSYAIRDCKNFSPLYILGLLNSKFMTYYIRIKFKDKHLAGGYLSINAGNIEQFPIAEANNNKQQEVITLVEKMITTHNEINAIDAKIFKLLQGDFSKININKQLGKWSELSWNEFLSEIAKQKFELTSKQEEKWLERFEEKQAEVKQLQSTITRTDAEIDKMVYALYGLSQEEIRVVEDLVV